MACTRDKNSKENYKMEQISLEKVRENLTFYNAANGHAYKPAFPNFYNVGHVPPDVFSCNSIDIESSLFGINSCNLENPRENTVAKLKQLPEISFFDKTPIVKSKSIYNDNTQRPIIS